MRAFTIDETKEILGDFLNFIDMANTQFKELSCIQASRRAQLELNYKKAVEGAKKEALSQKNRFAAESAKMVRSAESILTTISNLEAQLEAVDKYYGKTKRKKEQELASRKSPLYNTSQNAFETLADLQARCEVLTRKYSTEILPGLLNGAHYLFSSTRRAEYEELIVLRSTTQVFVDEITSMLNVIAADTELSVDNDLKSRLDVLAATYQRESRSLKEACIREINAKRDSLAATLDVLLPTEFMKHFSDQIGEYLSLIKEVNSTTVIVGGVLGLTWAIVPLDALCEDEHVKSLVRLKCASMSVEGKAIFPFAVSIHDDPVWFIVPDESEFDITLEFVHAMMNSFLATVPVAQMRYCVIDPENRGNSIAPFFDARKKLPSLFPAGISIASDQIVATVDRLNHHIEDVLQSKLGNSYENVFEYSAHCEDYTPEVQLVTIFDFPRGFDDRAIASLRNVVRNGRRAGVYVVIVQEREDDSRSTDSMRRAVKSVIDLSVVVKQKGNSLSLFGFQLGYADMPDRVAFGQYFNKYLLLFEGVSNRGIAFPPMIRNLVDETDEKRAQEGVAALKELDDQLFDRFCVVPSSEAGFIRLVPFGRVSYPASIFTDSIGSNALRCAFRSDYESGQQSNLCLPLVLDMEKGFNLFVESGSDSNALAIAFAHHAMWHFFSFLPPTKASVIVFDPEKRGNSIEPFLELRKAVPEAFDDMIYTDQDSITLKLKAISAKIDELVQEKLGGRFANLLDFNAASPSRAEALRLLVVFDFPAGFDSRSVSYLQNIIKNGGRCGISTLVIRNTDVMLSKYDDMEKRVDNLRKQCSDFNCSPTGCFLEPFGLRFTRPDAPTQIEIDRFVEGYHSSCISVRSKGLSFSDILPNRLFDGDSSGGLSIPIGIGDADSIVSVTMGRGSSHHGLIAGATGSGKSTLLHTLIMGAMLNYSPEQLQLYLMDFKGGTEFKIYESRPMPHIRLLALDAMQEFGESILEELVHELDTRSMLFKQAGQSGLKGYVRETGNTLPRILVIMDEFQILFNYSSNRKVANNCAELAKRIVTEGRSYGIHLLMATQSTKVINDLTISKGTIEQMRIRIGMKCNESDARYLFNDEGVRKSLELMKGPIGTAVLNQEYMEEECRGFRVAYCCDEMRENLLGKISQEFSSFSVNTQVFEGGRVTDFISFAHTLPSSINDDREPIIHLGDLVKVAPPFAITLDRRRRRNILICGANETMATNLINLNIASMLMAKDAQVFYIDGDLVLEGERPGGLCAGLESVFGSRFRYAKSREDIFTLVNEAYRIYENNERNGISTHAMVVFKDLQFLEDVKRAFRGDHVEEPVLIDSSVAQTSVEETAADDEFAFDPDNPFASLAIFQSSRTAAATKFDQTSALSFAAKIHKISDSGYSRGVHLVVSSGEYQSVNECMRMGERVLMKFPERFIFSLGDNDAFNLIEGVSTTSLRDNTVYYTDSVRNVFQLKPYRMPSDNELVSFFEERFGR